LNLCSSFSTTRSSTSHFPDVVKLSTISTIFKRSSRLDLSNYRGICCSNFLLGTPFMWLNRCLVPYLVKQSVLPPGQIATQPGIQGHDLTSFFAQLESWASREKVPLFALRRGVNGLEEQCQHPEDALAMGGKRRSTCGAAQLYPRFVPQRRIADM
jgi:hypothetical protein